MYSGSSSSLALSTAPCARLSPTARIVPLAWTAAAWVLFSCSPNFWNEAWDAGIHDWIQTLPGLNSIDFIEGVLG